MLLALMLLLAALAPGAALPVAAAGVITADPSSISVAVALGGSLTRTVTLQNTTSAALTPAIYEAYPAQPLGALAGAGRLTGPRSVALPRQPARLDAKLLDDFQATPGGQADFLVYLHDQADLSAAYQIGDWAERGRYVYQALADQAERSQRGLRAQLAARGLRFHPFWIVNAVLVHGGRADAEALIGRADVALVRANHVSLLPPDASAGVAATADLCSPDQPSNPICWNIRSVGADRVWRDFGVTGRGIVVANIDSGVVFTHTALLGQYRGYLGPDRYDHDYNWFDPQGSLPAPFDGHGHGTHTMGTMVAAGDGTPDKPSVGTAPGARWVAAQGCAGSGCSESDLIASAQWVLAPTTIDGTLPRPDLRPMIVNNSWGGPGGDDWYAGYTAAWRAAGIFPVFAAGNTSSGVAQQCGSIASPGDYADVVAVGATDKADTIASFSLLGPAADGRMKPDFVAPGTWQSYQQGLLSTYIGSTPYNTVQGTSMAAPHISGIVALLWSANPALIGDYEATYAILRDTARRVSDTRCQDAAGDPNNVYGYGRVDAFAAVAKARVDVPWLIAPASIEPLAGGGSGSFAVVLDARRVPGPGTYRARLQVFGADLGQAPMTIDITMDVTPAAQQAELTGRVVSANSGAPLAAVVGVEDGLGVATDSSGVYTLTLALGTYELAATAPSFLPGAQTIALTGTLRAPDIALQPDTPRLVLATDPLTASLSFGEQRQVDLPLGNSGTRTLYYKAQVLPDRFGVWRSDEPGGPTYAWVDLPPNAKALDLKDAGYVDEVPLGIDFPFFSYTVTETLVTSDGTLTFVEPFHYEGLLNRCLPGEEIFFYMVAPFRTDLDPSLGGKVRYGTITDTNTFVLSYEDVPLHNGPADRTYTFQVLLHADGRVVFQYKTLAELPQDLSVGIQRTLLDAQQIGCGRTTPIRDGLAIEMRPQPLPSLWLKSVAVDGELPPGEQVPLDVMLSWVVPQLQQPYRGRLEITSTDPMRPIVIVPVEVATLPAPYQQLLAIMPHRK